MTISTRSLDYFLDDIQPAEAYREAQEVGRATRNLVVYCVENYKLVPVCSLAEFRVAVAFAGLAMAAYALDKRRAVNPDAVLALPSELSDLPTLMHALAQGDSPRLIEGSLDVWQAGPHPVWRDTSDVWPKGTVKLPGYQGGVEGWCRLASACWTPECQWFSTTEHGISSVLPRTKEAFKHLRVRHGLPVAYGDAVLRILERVPSTPLLQFLNEPAPQS